MEDEAVVDSDGTVSLLVAFVFVVSLEAREVSAEVSAMETWVVSIFVHACIKNADIKKQAKTSRFTFLFMLSFLLRGIFSVFYIVVLYFINVNNIIIFSIKTSPAHI